MFRVIASIVFAASLHAQPTRYVEFPSGGWRLSHQLGSHPSSLSETRSFDLGSGLSFVVGVAPASYTTDEIVIRLGWLHEAESPLELGIPFVHSSIRFDLSLTSPNGQTIQRVVTPSSCRSDAPRWRGSPASAPERTTIKTGEFVCACSILLDDHFDLSLLGSYSLRVSTDHDNELTPVLQAAFLAETPAIRFERVELTPEALATAKADRDSPLVLGQQSDRLSYIKQFDGMIRHPLKDQILIETIDWQPMTSNRLPTDGPNDSRPILQPALERLTPDGWKEEFIGETVPNPGIQQTTRCGMLTFPSFAPELPQPFVVRSVPTPKAPGVYRLALRSEVTYSFKAPHKDRRRILSMTPDERKHVFATDPLTSEQLQVLGELIVSTIAD